MKTIKVILGRDFRELRQSNAFLIMVILIGVITVAGAVASASP